ncbi:hypothetical protein CDAR_8151 [Caerostris darwini]|uniref:Gamma-secretase subunit PEN-2 n=1 Tax=Caerostris darwini TaxID=1538125 RepID=A0AAV4SVD8_9ARAC|nr:hypothetical protein CDAR_8151 [Caerostris darwini]
MVACPTFTSDNVSTTFLPLSPWDPTGPGTLRRFSADTRRYLLPSSQALSTKYFFPFFHLVWVLWIFFPVWPSFSHSILNRSRVEGFIERVSSERVAAAFSGSLPGGMLDLTAAL